MKIILGVFSYRCIANDYSFFSEYFFDDYYESSKEHSARFSNPRVNSRRIGLMCAGIYAVIASTPRDTEDVRMIARVLRPVFPSNFDHLSLFLFSSLKSIKDYVRYFEL